MEGSKLIGLLKTFEKEDWTWFRKFLLSPYFNSREELIPFLDYLRGQSPEFKTKAIQKERVFKKLFPKEAYDEKKISYTMNFLLNQAERFLAQREIESQPPLISNYLQKSLVDRQLDKHYKYQYEKSLKSLNKEKAKNINAYFFEYQITEIANEHYANQNFRHFDPNLQSTSDTLDNFYVLNKIRCFCEMLGRARVMETSYELTMEKEVTDLIKTKDFSSYPLILIYLEIYYLVKAVNAEENFENLKELLEKYNNNIPLAEKVKIYEYATNYCVRQINKNNNRLYYAEQLLNLYLNGVEQGFLLKNGYLSPWHFKNTVKLGLSLKKYDFTEEFVQKYHKKLEEEFQEDALHYNLADIFYRKKEYQEAHTHLIQVQFSDLFYNLGSKAMLLKIYYETNEGEALLALIASFSIYLRRNKKLTKETRESYLNFTSILSRVVRSHKEKFPRIVEKIKETKRVNNRSWLLGICQ